MEATTAQRPPTYRRSILLAAAAFGLGFGTLVLRLTDPDASLTFYLAAVVFLLIAPALHVVGIVLAVQGIRRGYGRFKGFLCLLLHVGTIFLGLSIGAVSIVDLSS